jgi:hypothetical protein
VDDGVSEDVDEGFEELGLLDDEWVDEDVGKGVGEDVDETFGELDVLDDEWVDEGVGEGEGEGEGVGEDEEDDQRAMKVTSQFTEDEYYNHRTLTIQQRNMNLPLQNVPNINFSSNVSGSGNAILDLAWKQ